MAVKNSPLERLRRLSGAEKIGTASGDNLQQVIDKFVSDIALLVSEDASLLQQHSNLVLSTEAAIGDLEQSLEDGNALVLASSRSYTDQKISLLSGEVGNGNAEDQSLFISMIQEAAHSRLVQFTLKESLNEVVK